MEKNISASVETQIAVLTLWHIWRCREILSVSHVGPTLLLKPVLHAGLPCISTWTELKKDEKVQKQWNVNSISPRGGMLQVGLSERGAPSYCTSSRRHHMAGWAPLCRTSHLESSRSVTHNSEPVLFLLFLKFFRNLPWCSVCLYVSGFTGTHRDYGSVIWPCFHSLSHFPLGFQKALLLCLSLSISAAITHFRFFPASSVTARLLFILLSFSPPAHPPSSHPPTSPTF